MRRKPGALVPLEVRILRAAADLDKRGQDEFYGLGMATLLHEQDPQTRMIPQGTMYAALARMQRAGLMQSHWEDPEIAVAELRPRRRLYTLTTKGLQALAQAEAAGHAAPRRLRERPSQT